MSLTSTTRTRSLYFSENTAMAPASIAFCSGKWRVLVFASVKATSLIQSSICCNCLEDTGLPYVKSKRNLAGSTAEPEAKWSELDILWVESNHKFKHTCLDNISLKYPTESSVKKVRGCVVNFCTLSKTDIHISFNQVADL